VATTTHPNENQMENGDRFERETFAKHPILPNLCVMLKF
jgi:hypothetical protein